MRLALVLACAACPALAYEDTSKAALFLGGVIGSEDACGLTFAPSSIDLYITAQVDPSEPTFASALNVVIEGTKAEVQAMTPTVLEAHCSSIKHTARNYGLIR